MTRDTTNPQSGTLQALLERYRVRELKPLARLLTSSLPTRKAELIALISEHVRDPDRLRQLWDALDALQRAAVAETLHTGRFDTARFRAKYGGEPDWGHSRYGELERPSTLRFFVYHGVIPRELQPLLEEFVSPPRPASAQTVDQPPASVRQEFYDYERRERVTVDVPVAHTDTERAAQHDLLAVLRLINQGSIRAHAATKRITAAGARSIAEILLGGDFYALDEALRYWGEEVIGPIKAFAWPLILQSAGLVELAGDRLQLTGAGKRALSAHPHDAIHRAWVRWQETTLLDELNRIEAIEGQTGEGKAGLTAVTKRRAAIVAALRACPAHAWIAVDEFFRFMRAAGHAFEVSGDLYMLYVGDPIYGSLDRAGLAGWSILQSRYTMAFLWEYAATLGLIDVAYIHPAGARHDYGDLWGTDDMSCLSRYDGLLHFRINNLGSWCLGQVDEYIPTPFEQRAILKVLPNMDVVATERLPPGDVLFLELFAESTSDVVWTIRREKVLSALEKGVTVDELVAFLEAKSDNPLPEGIAAFLAELGERFSYLVAQGPGLLIQAQDAALAQLIANDSRTRSLCMLAGQRHLVVPKDAESAFRRALHEMGYGVSTPKK